MEISNRSNRDYIAIGITVAVTLNAFITYVMTMAPSIPFWDCGEFIACSYTLGVAHPPGTPLFILLGRLFIIFMPFFHNLAERVNFLSALTSSLAVGLTCMIVLKILVNWFKDKSIIYPYNILIYLGSAASALYLTYSSTFWFSAVEAEVYGAAMFLMQLIVYLSLLWYDNIGKPGHWKYLLLIFYLSFLSIAIHMTVFLIVPAIFIFIVLSDNNLLRDWRFWAIGLMLILAAASFKPFLIVAFLIIIAGSYFVFVARNKGVWKLVLMIALLAVIGFSVHLYVPIRSMGNPYLDMNNPESYQNFSYFMERQQYGDKSMLESMLIRKGSWGNQFGNFHNLGFWYFFKDQYSSPGLAVLPLLIGLLGVIISVWRDFKRGGFLTLLLLAGTIGLIFYMNFSDGLHGDRLEVRDRDYFFTPGFVYFALFIGIGVTGLGHLLYDRIFRGKNFAKIACLIPAIFMILLSLFQTAPAHWKSHDRTGIYVPDEYAYNMLNSCEPNAILFTNGDNDTYPLWCSQLVYNVRPDVRVMNLSLLNTDWYILQHKNQYGIPIPLEDDQIKWQYHRDEAGNLLMTPEKPFIDPITKQKKFLTPNRMNVKAEMVRLIILANNWKAPIYLATTVGDDVLDVAKKFLSRRGMVYKVTPEEHNTKFDVAITDSLLDKVYKYTNLNSPEVGLEATDLAMSVTYPETYISLAEQILAEGDTTGAIERLVKANENFPYYFRTAIKLKQLYTSMNRADEGLQVVQQAAEKVADKARRYPNEKFWHMFVAPLYLESDRIPEAIASFEKTLEIDPDEPMVLNNLLTAYKKTGQKDKGVKLLEWWKKNYPNDQYVQQLYSFFRPQFR